MAYDNVMHQEAKALALQKEHKCDKDRDLNDQYHGIIYSHII